MKKIMMLIVFLAVLVWSVSGYCQPSGQAGTGSSGSSVGDTGNASSAGQEAPPSAQTGSMGSASQESSAVSESSNRSDAIEDNAQQGREQSESNINHMEDQMASHSTSQKEVDKIGR